MCQGTSECEVYPELLGGPFMSSVIVFFVLFCCMDTFMQSAGRESREGVRFLFCQPAGGRG